MSRSVVRSRFESRPTECESETFAPDWVLDLYRVNRNFSVEITRSNPDYGEVHRRITLSKWWGDNSATFHINTPEQWVQVRDVIEENFGPELGWEVPSREWSITSPERSVTPDTIELPEPMVGRLDELTEIAEAIEFEELESNQIQDVSEALRRMSDLLTSADRTMLQASTNLIERLPDETTEAVEKLSGLLHTWSLRQITAVSSEVKRRLDLIDFFEDRILDEETYEIRGEDSIHRILENAMWIIDERYWLLQSNRTLRTLIGDELSDRDAARYGDLRPDFACGMIGNKLVIVEIKRPSHTLETEDLNQLETYIAVAEDYSDFSTFEAILVGNKKSDGLKKRLKYRGNRFKVRTYSDLIEDTRNRYQDYFETSAE